MINFVVGRLLIAVWVNFVLRRVDSAVEEFLSGPLWPAAKVCPRIIGMANLKQLAIVARNGPYDPYFVRGVGIREF